MFVLYTVAYKARAQRTVSVIEFWYRYQCNNVHIPEVILNDFV